MSELEKIEVQVRLLNELMEAGKVKELMGTYPTGELKYSYDLDNAMIGAALRQKVLWTVAQYNKLKENKHATRTKTPAQQG